MMYGAQLGVGYSFNKMALHANVSEAFAAAGAPVASTSTTRSWSGRS